jgi:hypothetical protein
VLSDEREESSILRAHDSALISHSGTVLYRLGVSLGREVVIAVGNSRIDSTERGISQRQRESRIMAVLKADA